MTNLIGWRDNIEESKGAINRPVPHNAETWPPDYDAVFRWRTERLKLFTKDKRLVKSAKKYYSTRPTEFIMDWMDTYDPRSKNRKWMPFVFFERQAEFIRYLKSLDDEQECGLNEKSRDMGATWAACAYSVWCWLFLEGDATGWGSRKESLVDKLGDPDSIFEKLRLLISRLPRCFQPEGFNLKRDSTYMKLTNPENGSVISGESGDNIGRGGRKSRYFKDEAAFYEHPEKIEAALGDNTRVQIDISSVNGLGTVFQNRREHGVEWREGTEMPKGYPRIFVMDWRDHPEKTQEWYDTRKSKYDREGMQHVFAQEVDRDPSAAVSNVIVQMQWIKAAIDAHITVPYFAAAVPEHLGRWTAGLDVADEGIDKNALSMREWVIWRSCQEWGERDPAITARRAIAACTPHSGKIECMYDCIGVGAGVKGEYNRLTQDDNVIDAHKIPFIPWNAGSGVINPFERIIPDDEESLTNKDYYDNLKAQGWGSLAKRFYKTYKAVTEGAIYPPDELISLDSTMPSLDKICKELAQPTRGHSSRMKMIVEKRNGGKSPNCADSGMQMFFPVNLNDVEIQIGGYGN